MDRALIKDNRRQQLIEATIVTLARHGFAKATLSRIAGRSGLSRGIVSFYFDSKERLLLATLESMAQSYTATWKRAVAEAGPAPGNQLAALIDVEFDATVSQRDRVAAWHAYWVESRSQHAYRKIYLRLGEEYAATLDPICCRLVAEEGGAGLDPALVANGLSALMTGLWDDLMMDPARFDRSAAKHTCRMFLAGLFPRTFGPLSTACSED